MRRLKHSPELVAWGEAYLDDRGDTNWLSESLYPIIGIDNPYYIFNQCQLPTGKYMVQFKWTNARIDDRTYISSREFELTNAMLYEGAYDLTNIMDTYNEEIVRFEIGYAYYVATNKITCSIYTEFTAPPKEAGTLTYKLWRIA